MLRSLWTTTGTHTIDRSSTTAIIHPILNRMPVENYRAYLVIIKLFPIRSRRSWMDWVCWGVEQKIYSFGCTPVTPQSGRHILCITEIKIIRFWGLMECLFVTESSGRDLNGAQQWPENHYTISRERNQWTAFSWASSGSVNGMGRDEILRSADSWELFGKICRLLPTHIRGRQ